MLKLDDVVWEEVGASNGPMVSKLPTKKKVVKKTNQGVKHKRIEVKETVITDQTVNTPNSEINQRSQGASLKDLNPLDKQRIADLIKELAKADEEKENIFHALEDEREKFVSHVKELENEKRMLLNRQDFLSEEVKQCQTLLQYYQSLITMQQTSLIAQEDTKKHKEDDSRASDESNVMTPAHNSTLTKDASFRALTPSGANSPNELSSNLDAIQVNEVSDAVYTDSSVADERIRGMDKRQYRSYLEAKKLRLQQEQERLRRLLQEKVKTSEFSDVELSPVRDSEESRRNIIASKVSDTQIADDKRQGYLMHTPHLSQTKQQSPRPSCSIGTPMRIQNVSQTNVHRSFSSPSHLTSTLRSSHSLDKLLDLTAPGKCYSDRKSLSASLCNNTTSPVPPDVPVSQFASTNGAAAANDLLTCDDSQILQEVFFL